MGANGYIALKLRRTVLHYADSTNTRRRYKLQEISKKNKQDLRRIFNGKTVLLIVDLERVLKVLRSLIGSDINTSKCVQVKDIGHAFQILDDYLERNQKKKSYYNYQREHWLSIISVINVHLLMKNVLSKNVVLKIIRGELLKYNRDIKAEILLEKFFELDLYKKLFVYNEEMVSLPDNKIDLTLG